MTSAVLEGKGYEQYLPLQCVRLRRSDRVVQTESPLFPGYVFCRFDVTRRLPIVTTPGVVSILGLGKTPVPVPDTEIKAIQTILRSGTAAEPCPFLELGQRIRVNQGSLEGLEGILLKKKTEWKVVVSITMLQRSLSVEINRDSITAVWQDFA